MNVRELVVKLTMQATNFEATANKAENAVKDVAKAEKRVGEEAEKAGKKAQDAGKEVQQAATDGAKAWENLTSAIKGAFAASAIISTAANFAEQTKQVDQFSSRLGMSVEEWQAWAGAAESTGAAADAFGDKLRDLSDWILDLNNNESGPLKDFADQVGVSFKDAAGASIGVEEGFLRIADAVAGMDREKATGWLTQMGFNEESLDLLLKGRKGVEELVKAYREKILYEKEDIETGRKIQNAWTGVSNTYQLVAARAMRMLAPAFDWVAEKADKVFSYIKKNGSSVERVFTAIGTIIGLTIIPKLKQMATAAWASMGPWALVGAAIMAIGLAIDDLMVWLDGGTSALGDFWSMFGTADEVRVMVESVRDALAGIVDTIKPMIPYVAKALAVFLGWKLVVRIASGVVGAVKGVSLAVKGLGTALRANPLGILITIAALVIDNWEAVKDFFAGLWEFIKGFGRSLADSFRGALDAVGEFVDSVVDGVQEKFQAVADAVKAIWQGVVSFFGGLPAALASFATDAANAIMDALSNAANAVREAWEAFFSWIAAKFEWIVGAVGKVMNFGKGIVSKAGNAISNFFGGGKDKSEGSGEQQAPLMAASHASTVAPSVSPYPAQYAPAGGTGTVQQATAGGGFGAPQNAKPANVTNNNQKTANINQTNNITVNAQSTDPQGVARETVDAFNANTASMADGALGA